MAKKKTSRKRRPTRERPAEPVENKDAPQDAEAAAQDAEDVDASVAPAESENTPQRTPEPVARPHRTQGIVERETALGESIRDIDFHRRNNDVYCPRLLKVGMLTEKQGVGLNALLQTAEEQGAKRYVGHGNMHENLRETPVRNHSDAIRWMLEQIAERVEERESSEG